MGQKTSALLYLLVLVCIPAAVLINFSGRLTAGSALASACAAFDFGAAGVDSTTSAA